MSSTSLASGEEVSPGFVLASLTEGCLCAEELLLPSLGLALVEPFFRCMISPPLADTMRSALVTSSMDVSLIPLLVALAFPLRLEEPLTDRRLQVKCIPLLTHIQNKCNQNEKSENEKLSESEQDFATCGTWRG